MKDFYKRLVSSFGFIIIAVALISFSYFPFFKFIIALISAGIAFLNCHEYLLIAKRKNVKLSYPLMLGFALIFPFSFFSSYQVLPLFVSLGFFLSVFLINFKKIIGAFERICFSLFGFVYAIAPIGVMYAILYSSLSGKIWLLYLLAVTKMSDIGAYAGGKMIGGKKIAENISPKKTLAGTVCGFIVSFMVSLLFAGKIGIMPAIFLGILFSVLAQLGDLCESLLKRDVDIKNSSRMPGLGGFLDVFDSLVFNAFFLYFYLIF
jgi:phosphatidate cytidylyltransferase